MKVRIGYGLGRGVAASPERFAAAVDAMERHGFDSLWVTERVTSDAFDPAVALAFAAARTERLKLGTAVMVLPGRNPALLAKELASLDRLSNGRLLPAFGLGVADPAEQQAFGVARAERAAWFDEALPLLRRFWAEDAVDHEGPRFSYSGLRVRPKPAQAPLDVWLGGRSPAELRRTGRLGDGWLPSFQTPDEVAAGRSVVERAAAEAGRVVDPEHFGALVPYGRGPHGEAAAALLAARRPGLPPADLADVAPVGWPALRTLLERYVERGFSKFVLFPLAEPESWDDELAEAAAEVLPMQYAPAA